MARAHASHLGLGALVARVERDFDDRTLAVRELVRRAPEPREPHEFLDAEPEEGRELAVEVELRIRRDGGETLDAELLVEVRFDVLERAAESRDEGLPVALGHEQESTCGRVRAPDRS